ncbi:hypothetical protein [Mesorhizobium sp. IMUNJ 23232]|uniref:hypothetical protein n=1 Tax=Mesorhizobium sp. IMUNJ 23232 TaxID=3376064 RepID=UPI003796E472
MAIGDTRCVARLRESDIKTRPDELIGFRKNDPGSLVIQAEAVFGVLRNLEGWRATKRTMGYGQHDYGRGAFVGFDSDYYGTGSVFSTFFATGIVFIRPQIAVANDQSWDRLRKRRQNQPLYS